MEKKVQCPVCQTYAPCHITHNPDTQNFQCPVCGHYEWSVEDHLPELLKKRIAATIEGFPYYCDSNKKINSKNQGRDNALLAFTIMAFPCACGHGSKPSSTGRCTWSLPTTRDEKTIIFVDNGFSGGNVNRDGFQKMMKLVRQGKVKKVIVYKLDRISRSLSDFVNILQEFKEHRRRDLQLQY